MMRKKETQENILSFIDAVDKLLIWLSSDELIFTQWDTGGNVGLGKALN